jgi:c-di-GMP-binding flagellar brake protein YcgR
VQPVLLRGGQALRVWEPVEIVIGEGPDVGRYRARIEDFINGGIVVTEPEFIGGKSLLRDRAWVTVSVCHQDAIYEFQSQIKQTSSMKGRHLVLTPPVQVRRVQRRRFCRVELVEKFSYISIGPDSGWQDFEKKDNWHQAESVDLSGGGMLARMNESLPVGQIVVIRLGLFKTLDLPHLIAAECRRAFQRDGESLAGMEFLTADRLARRFSDQQLKQLPPAIRRFDNKAQDRLVSYVFNLQIEWRNKGLL